MALARLRSSWSCAIWTAKSGVEGVIGGGAATGGGEDEDAICTLSPGNKLNGVSMVLAETC